MVWTNTTKLRNSSLEAANLLTTVRPNIFTPESLLYANKREVTLVAIFSILPLHQNNVNNI